MKLGSFIDKRAILAGDHFDHYYDAIDALIDIFGKLDLLPVSTAEVKDKVREREAQGTTVLPTGVAIPHARIEGFQDLLIGVWIPEEPLKTEQGEIGILFFFLTSQVGSLNYLPILSSIARSCSKDNFPYNLKGMNIHQIQDYFNGMVFRKELTVEDIMTPDPVTCSKDTTLEELLDLFFEKGLSYIPVIDEKNRQIGEVTIKDVLSEGVPDYIKRLGNVRFLKTLEPFEALLRNEKTILVKDIMRPCNRGLPKEASIIEAVSNISSKGYRHLPIFDGKELIGLVSETDILHKVLRG
ncbi:CBS domain-containing protein [Spirochaeta isovalerica]|uniref:PTS system nitrogen regulatory IIA component n=1 Tax=Spirochaeta isovalerica TaxID=150 RepID=A0A841R5K7_9SPIO|nr:CBS domain-containing protein [Spirochaeta isovalerica]MBB6478437.1 PTS system nitrogen regulatory IIA component [Spirochaeta isovalerica]